MSSEPSFNNKSIQKNSRALFVKKIDVKSFKEINEHPELVMSGRVVLVNDGRKTIPYYAYNNNSTIIEIPDAFLQNRNEVLINNIIRRNNERDNNVNEINDNNANENHNNDDFEEIEDISESDNENALDEGIINTFPKAIIDNIENLKEKNCAICLEDFKKGEEQMTIPCFHMFHSNCISPWFELHNCCPVCKLNCNCKNSNIYKYSNRLF